MEKWPRFILIGILVFTGFMGLCQDTDLPNNGVYSTLTDYLNKHLIYSFPQKKDGYKLRQPRVSIIKITTPAETVRIDLRTIWGYRENGSDWVYRNGELYELINHDGIWVYKQSVISDGGFRDLFFFSKDGNSELFWLDYKNLKTVYYSDKEFLKALEDVKWFQSLDFYNLRNHKLEIVNIYQSSHKNE